MRVNRAAGWRGAAGTGGGAVRRIGSGDIHAIKVGSRHRISLRAYERFRDARATG